VADPGKRTEYPVQAKDLQCIHLFADLEEGERERLAARAVELRLDPEEYVISEGEVSENFYIVLEGVVAAFRDAVGEPAQLLAHLRAGDFFGEIGLFATVTHSASVRTTRASRLFKIGKTEFLTFLEDHPEIHDELEMVASRRHGANIAASLALGRQREVRMRLHREVTIELEDGSTHQSMLENLSVGGFCLHRAPESWQADRTVKFGIDLGPGTLQLCGRVAWRRGDVVGIAFSELLANHDMMIQLAIHLLLDSPSWR
jgi:CRP-like cAMP-binding protein